MNFYDIKSDDKDDTSCKQNLGDDVRLETDAGKVRDIDIKYDNILVMWYDPMESSWEIISDKQVEELAICIEVLMDNFSDLSDGEFANEIIQDYVAQVEATREEVLEHIGYSIPEPSEEEQQQDNEEVRQQQEDTDEDRSVMQARLDSAKEQRRQAEEKVGRLQERIDNLKDEKEELKEERDSAQRSRQQAEEKVVELVKNRERVQGRLNAYQDAYSELVKNL